jgi:hypothetical protein
MKKLSKTIKIVLSVILIVVVVIVVLVNVLADSAVRIGIETAATKALNVGVKVGKVDLSILGGKVSIADMAINNPPGYKYEKMLELGSGKIQVDVGSLLSDTIKVKEFNLDGIDLVIEQKNITNNNIYDVINSISAQEKKQKEPKEAKAEPSGKNIQVEKLRISNVTVKAKLLPVPGKADTVTLKLSPIEMNNLGTDSKMSTIELSRRIMVALADGVAKQGAGLLPDNLTDTMKSALAQTEAWGKLAAEEGKKLIGAGKDVVDTGKDLGKEITEGFKGLLKPKE